MTHNPPIALAISQIKRLNTLQPRSSMNMEVVKEYAALMRSEVPFPPVSVYFDGTERYLVDGYHRLTAAEMAGLKVIQAIVFNGTLREATLYSVGANSDHGLRRSNEDKRRAVLTLLKDEEWGKWSNLEIARKCKVSDGFVRIVKEESNIAPCDVVKMVKNGKETTMDTSNIKKANKKEESTPPKRCHFYHAGLRRCTRGERVVKGGPCPLSDEQREAEQCPLKGMQPPDPLVPTEPDEKVPLVDDSKEKNHGILALCKTRNKGEPCENFVKRTMNNNRECSLTGYLPGNMTQCPMDAARGSAIKISEEKKLELARGMTHVEDEIINPETFGDTPEDQPAPDTFHRAGPSAVTRRITDYETLAKEGDLYPITRRTAQTINQMVEYGISPDNLDAHALIEKDGYDGYLDQIEEFLKAEDVADPIEV